MQCKDIPAEPVLRFLASLNGQWANWFDDAVRNERSVRQAMPPGTPDKLVLGKMRMLLRAGLVDGCGCGCRGDFHLTAKGRARLACEAKTTIGIA
jgi:hypothetical protein